MTTYETLTTEQQTAVDKAISLIELNDIKELTYGEDIELTKEVCMSHYCEDDVIVLNLIDEWTEVFQVLYSDNDYILESL